MNLSLNSSGSSGKFENLSNPFDQYCFDPQIFTSILQLAPISTFQWSLPAVQRIVSIKSVLLPFAKKKENIDGLFTIDVQPTDSGTMQANVGNGFGDNSVISIVDLRFAHEKIIEQTSTPWPLFFKPVMLPDITQTESTTEPKFLSDVLRLVTHKWPMSDIAITEMTNEDVKPILDSLQGTDGGGRLHLRSVTIASDLESQPPSSKIWPAEKLSSDRQYHLVFLGDDHIDAEEAYRLVLPSGLICVRIVEERQDCLLESFVKLCDVRGINDEHIWSLWRCRTTHQVDPPSASDSRLTLFGNDGQLLALRGAFP